ncbi:prolow-density lipoprotein receptor-related protein 1 [Penaeus vannamei]|uniref:prolow-density lipoprotein receptor-related protein 1 n=1 Tax=Penaeus vannamei TaxID=6689 RepID=UPI00387F5120
MSRETFRIVVAALALGLLNGTFGASTQQAQDNAISDRETSNSFDKGAVLGETCVINKHCVVAKSVCSEGRCSCPQHYLQLDKTTCLPGVLLGFRCQVDAQCSMRVGHSACIQGFCRCGANYVPYRRNNCLKRAVLGQVCRTHEQCRLGASGSFCSFIVPRVYGHCECLDLAPRIGNTCGHVRYSLGSPCGTSAQCSAHVPGSVCVIQKNEVSEERVSPNSISAIPGVFPMPIGVPRAVCACPPGHLEGEDGARCIPVLKDAGVIPASLGQRCESSRQCRESDPYTFCRGGVCHCIADTPQCSASNTGCHKDTFQCVSDGRCLSWYFVCNGVRDCFDGSDEDSCVPHRCPKLAHTCADGTCISRARLCDGKVHCPDGSDEANCRGASCPSSTFQCGDGRCLPAFVFCNAKATCLDGSDEDEEACIQGSITARFCPFRCGNGRCRSTAILCSGSDGCGDNSDEENCSVCSCTRPTIA